MKKIFIIFCLIISSVVSAQKIIKYNSVNYFFIERMNGKEGFSKPEKVNVEILLDINNKIITVKQQIYQIIELKPTESGSNFTMSNYRCLDENKLECNISIHKFTKPNNNGVLQQLFISYKKIEHVYDMNLIEN